MRMYEIPRDRLLYIEDLRPGDKFRVVKLREGGDPTWLSQESYKTLTPPFTIVESHWSSLYHLRIFKINTGNNFAEGAEVELV